MLNVAPSNGVAPSGGGNLQLVETGISVYTYATEHPINTHCVVSMIGLPSFEGMNSVVVMKVA